MRYIVLAFAVALAVSAAALATENGGSSPAPKKAPSPSPSQPLPPSQPPPDSVTAQYDEASGHLELTVTPSRAIFVTAGHRTQTSTTTDGCDGLQTYLNAKRGNADVYLASDPNANHRLRFPIEQRGSSASVVVPQQRGELPLRPECLSVVLNPYTDDMRGLPPVAFDQSGKAAVSP